MCRVFLATSHLDFGDNSSRLDHCNCLLVGIADGLMRRLHAVQNAAVRLITDVTSLQFSSASFKFIGCLSVNVSSSSLELDTLTEAANESDFKLATLVFRTLHGSAPQYLVDGCQRVTA